MRTEGRKHAAGATVCVHPFQTCFQCAANKEQLLLQCVSLCFTPNEWTSKKPNPGTHVYPTDEFALATHDPGVQIAELVSFSSCNKKDFLA